MTIPHEGCCPSPISLTNACVHWQITKKKNERKERKEKKEKKNENCHSWQPGQVEENYDKSGRKRNTSCSDSSMEAKITNDLIGESRIVVTSSCKG